MLTLTFTLTLTLTHTRTITLTLSLTLTLYIRFDRILRYLARGPMVEAEALTEDPWTGNPNPITDLCLLPNRNPNHHQHLDACFRMRRGALGC